MKLASLFGWYRHSQDRWRQIKLSHQLLLSAVPAACLVTVVVTFAWPAGMLLATVFHIEPDAPLRGQPGEYAIIAAYIALLVALVTVGCSIGSFLVALWLRFARGYSWAQVARIALHSEYPAHWLRK